MKKALFAAIALALAAGLCQRAQARPNGNLDLKVAVVTYNPWMTNVVELKRGQRLNAVFGWPTGQSMANDQRSWWKQATDYMVKPDFVVVTNLSTFPRNTHGERFTPQSYYDYRKKGGPDGGTFDYRYCLTNDLPWLLPMVESRQIDQVWLYLFPGVGANETKMFGKGAMGCNSGGDSALGNERLFMVCAPSIERSDTPMENFGHGCEWVLASWWWNYVYSYTGGINYTNTSDLALFRAHGSECKYNINIGDVHYAPNSVSDYDWGNHTPVESYADCWYDFPDMTNWVPRTMTCADWGGGVNHKHKIWFLNHMPRRMGLRRGHLMNWMTKYMNPNEAAYPLGSGETVEQTDVDLAGFFAFEASVPESATQVVFRVRTGLPTMAGIRKDVVPFFSRYAGSGGGYDEARTLRQTEHEFVLTKDQCYGRDLPGIWYVTFGNAYGPAPTTRPLDANTNYVVSVEILPKPQGAGAANELTVTRPAQGEICRNMNQPVEWSYTAPEAGWRSFAIALSTNDFAGPFNTVCEDFYYELDKRYNWDNFPYKMTSPTARIRVIARDRYDNAITNYSGLFGISTEPIPEPAAALLALLALAACLRRR